MTRLIVTLAISVFAAGCAAPIQSLPGRVVDAQIVIEPDKLRMIDWANARQIAASDGVRYEAIPQSSPKPTSEEIATANALLERNRAYTEYVNRPEVLKRAQDRSSTAVERWLVTTPDEPFLAKGINYPVLNNASGPGLRLVLFPKGAIVSPRSDAERSTGQALGAALAAGLSSGSRPLMRYVGGYELRYAKTDRLVSSGELNSNLEYDPGLGVSDPYERIFATMIWDDIMRGNVSAIRTKRSVAARTPVTPSSQPLVRTTDAKPQMTVPTQTSQTEPPVPGSPPLFEGTSYALFTPAHIQAYCQQNWRTRATQDGRTEYNPCTERSAFGQ